MLTDTALASTTASTFVVFASDVNYAPAVELIDLLTATEHSKVRVLNRFSGAAPTTSTVERLNINTVSKEVIQDYFQGAEAAFMLLVPTDLADVTQLTRSLLEVATKAGVRRFAWVAPACPSGTELSNRLAEAANLVQASGKITLVLYHAPLFSDLLDQKKELRFRRALSLPLGDRSLPWLAPEAITTRLNQWLRGGPNSQPPELLTGSVQLTGQDLAQGLSDILKQTMQARQFAQRRFQAIDLDQSGQIDPEELFPYLLELGYSHDDAQTVLQQADQDGSGTIDFEEFIHGLEDHLNKILSGVPTDVQFYDVSASAALYDWQMGGMSEQAAQSRLEWFTALKQQGLPEQGQAITQGLNRSEPSLADWANQHVLDLINVYILPGRGILTISEGMLEGRPALTTRLLQANDRLLVGQRSLDGELLEWRWADAATGGTEEVRYTADNGNERVLRLRDGKLVGLSVQGRWTGRRLAIQLFLQDQPLPRWQLALFRELGELQIEEVTTTGADSDIVCNCTRTTCGRVRELMATGLDTLEGIIEQTQVTMVCGSCQPLVEEMLGSASLAVAELIGKQDLGRGMMRFQFRPVYEEVVASKPGQHILVQGRVDGSWVTRAYTLSSAADQTECYEVTVKREELGLFSRWLYDRADSEALLRISQPRGEFFLADETPVVFFAGGIGVTPAISMMRTLASRGDTRKFHLDWSVSHPEDFVLQPELEQLSATHPNLTVTLRATRTQGRLSATAVQSLYPPTESTVAFMCGSPPYMEAVRDHLKRSGWDDSTIREELFSSKLDEEGKAKAPIRPAIQLAGGITPIEQISIYVEPINSVMQEAEAFLKQCYLEQGLAEVFTSRWQEVKAAIEQTGTYEHTYDELAYGTKLSWRNSNRCLGRNFWRSLQLRDLRHLQTEEEIFQTLVEHIKFATNNGNLRSTITILNPHLKIRLWSNLMLRYAGYRQPDGTILGDPANLELTEQALKLGWSNESRTRFDVLPLIIQIGEQVPKWFEIPPDTIMEVPLSHPRYNWFEELGLKWFALPAVANMMLDMGGIQYPTPFNGFYMGAEIGARNFSDSDRYNLLPIVAEKMGLDCSETMTLWKDSALVEINVAVLHSYKQHGVRMLDHHALTGSFMQFVEDEQQCGRQVYGDKAWLTPPLSASTTPVFNREFENRLLKPNYFYQRDPWQTESSGKCPFHHQA